jgi:VWFA-related protein
MRRFEVPRMRFSAFWLALAPMFFPTFCCGPNAAAQAGASLDDNATRLKAESNLVLVRVVVRDGHGVPIAGLKKEDFRLLDRGKEQVISQFDEEAGSSSEPGKASPGAGESGHAESSAAATSGAGKTTRLVAFFFDDLNAKQANLMQARDAAEGFIQKHLGVRDEVAVFTSETMLTDFTRDGAKIHEALGRLNGSSRPVQAVRRCPDLSEYQAQELLRSTDYLHNSAWQLAAQEVKACSGGDPDPKVLPSGTQMASILAQAQSLVDLAEARTRDNLQQLEQVTKYMAKLPGQRTIVLVSPGFLSESEQHQLDRIIEEALRSQVVVNALDPKGLEVMMREQDASRGVMVQEGSTLGGTYALDAAAEFTATNVMAELAQGTGGRFFHNNNDLGAGFDALAGHPDTYVLGFSPRELKRDGKFHELKVTLSEKQKGVTLSARRGYFAEENAPDTQMAGSTSETVVTPVPTTTASPAEASKVNSAGAGPAVPAPVVPGIDESIRRALLGSEDISELPVGAEVQTAGGQVSVLIHLDAKALPFRKDGDRSLDTVTFAAAMLGTADQAGQIKQRSAKLNLTQEQLDSLIANGIELTFTFPADPGAHRVRAVVMESEGHKIGSVSKEIGQ